MASELPAETPKLTQTVDVSSESDVKSFVSAIVDKFGRLDHVFNCAGVNPTNIPFQETSLDYWNKQVDVNLKGVFLVTRESLPHLKRGASIVTVSSMSGSRGTALQGVYSKASNYRFERIRHTRSLFKKVLIILLPDTTKHGVIGMMKSVALEVGPRGIRANCVAPGYINTPTNSGIVAGGEIVERWAKAYVYTPLNCKGTPIDEEQLRIGEMGYPRGCCRCGHFLIFRGSEIRFRRGL